MVRRRKLKLAQRHRVETFRLYQWEEETIAMPKWLFERWPMARLRRLAQRIWDAHGRGRLPRIVAGRGCPVPGGLTSFCDTGDDGQFIVLARHHRYPQVLVHEITHALGHPTHGPGFARRYIALLQEFCGCDGDRLRFEAGIFGVRA